MTAPSPSPPDGKRRALGRGLEALLPSRPVQTTAPDTPSTGQPLEIALDLLDRNPFQTRTTFDAALIEELANSIAATGVVQPIVVRALPGGRFQLIAGERRTLASRQAGKTTIPAIVREVSDAHAMEMTIVENLQRADLNPMEQARAFDRLSRDFKMTQEEMAKRTGKDRASVSNFLRLLRLPAEVQQRVEAGELSFGHARTLLALESAEQIAAAARKVLALSMSVRQTETYVKGQLDPERKLGRVETVAPEVDPNVREAQVRLQQALGLKVFIDDNHGRGKVTIEYRSLEDFDALLEHVTGKDRAE